MSSGRDEGSPWRRRRAAIERVTRSQLVGGIVFLVAGVGFALVTAYLVDREVHLGASAPTTTATVVDIVRAGENEEVVVDFTTDDGRRVRAQSDEFVLDPRPEPGDELAVRYDPDEPAVYVRDVRWGGSYPLPTLMGVAAALFLWGGVAGLRRRLPTWIMDWNR